MIYPKYDYDELRKISEDSEEDSDDESGEPENPNYQCAACEKKTRIDGEHKMHVKYWCRDCDEIQTHQKL